MTEVPGKKEKGEKRNRMLDVRSCPVPCRCRSPRRDAAAAFGRPPLRRSLSKTPGHLRSVSSHLPHQRPSWGGAPSPPLGQTRRSGCRVGRSGLGGRVWGAALTPAPPSSRASKPSWISNKNLCRETACRWQCDAVPPPGAPRPASLLDGLPVAVSLALLPGAGLAGAAGAGPAAGASVPGAAGLAAVLQRGAGVGALQPVVLQQLGLENGQVLLAAPDLGPQQHHVGPVPRFLGRDTLLSSKETTPDLKYQSSSCINTIYCPFIHALFI